MGGETDWFFSTMVENRHSEKLSVIRDYGKQLPVEFCHEWLLPVCCHLFLPAM
jgi:hypothetical protein